MGMPTFNYTVHDLNRMADEPEPPTIEVEFHRIEENADAVKDQEAAQRDGRRRAWQVIARDPEVGR